MSLTRPPRLFRPESVSESLSVYLPATVLSRMVGMVRGVLLAWFMTQPEFGLLQITLLVVNLLNPVCSGGLNDAVTRYVPLYEARGSLRPFLRVAVLLVLGVGAVLSVLVFATAGPVGRFLFETLRPGGEAASPGAALTLTRVAVTTALALIGFYLLISILKGLRMYRAIGLIELAGNTSFAALAIGVAWAGWNTAGAVVGSYAIALGGMALLFALPLRGAVAAMAAHEGASRPTSTDSVGPPRGAPGFGPMARTMFRYSSWAALAAVMWQVLLGYPLWYLQKVQGPVAAALFGGVQLLAQGVVIVAASIVMVVQTSVTRLWETRGVDEADRKLLLAHKAAALLLLLGCAAASALAPVVMRLLPSSYAAGAAIMPELLLFFLLAGHLLFLGVHFHLIEKTRHLFAPWLMGGLGHAVFAALAVPHAAGAQQAIAAAGWAAAGGLSVALVSALLLIWWEGRPLDRGTWLLIAAGYSLAVPLPGAAAVAGAAALVLSVAGRQVFNAQEKQQLQEQIAHAWRMVSGIVRARRGA